MDGVAARIERVRADGEPVRFTRDIHDANYAHTQGRNLPVPHCIRGVCGCKISAKPDVSGSSIVDKHTFGSCDMAQEPKSRCSRRV